MLRKTSRQLLTHNLLKVSTLAMALTASSAHAADLMSIWKDALTSDPTYQSARFDLQATRERIPQAKSALMPQVGASVSVGESYSRLKDAVGVNPFTGAGGTKNVEGGSRSYGVTLSQKLYDKQANIAITQSEKQVEIAEVRFADAQQDLMLRVATAYFDVLLAKDNVALSGAQKTAITEQLAQAKRNFEVGTATIVDTQEAQSRFDLAVAREIADQSDLEVKSRAIELLTGKPVNNVDSLRDPLKLEDPTPNRINDWVNAANERNNGVRQSLLASDISRAEIDRSKAAFSPTVSATAGSNLARSNSGLLNAIGPNSWNNSIGVSLSVPIFNGGFNDSRIREAVANNDKSQADLERARRSATQGARQLYLGVTSGIAQVRALEAALASSQKQLESTIVGRDVGVRTGVDVLNAQQGVFQTRRDLQAGRYAYLTNTLRLKAAVGDLQESDLQKINMTLEKK
jgi:outer membrane protein